jgi:mono/diheme cytochrome c family protein
LKTIYMVFAIAGLIAIGCGNKDAASTSTTTSGGAATPAAGGNYAAVQAIFTAHCAGCHGENGKGGINLTSYDATMKGGAEGPVVVAGDPENSVLVQALRGSHGKKQMPMKQAPLDEKDIKTIEDWIKAGAKNG